MARKAPTCMCGSSRFKADFTLQLFNVPVLLGKDGSLNYDDTKGYTDGWDTIQQPGISCACCGHIYHLLRLQTDTKDGWPRYRLQDMQPKESPHGR